MLNITLTREEIARLSKHHYDLWVELRKTAVSCTTRYHDSAQIFSVYTEDAMVLQRVSEAVITIK